MRYKAGILFKTFLILCCPLVLFAQPGRHLNWKALPSFETKGGMGGIYMGVSDGTLFILGDTGITQTGNYPGAAFELNKKREKWLPVNGKLPIPLAFGASVSYNNQLIIIGGKNNQGASSAVYSAKYSNGSIQFKELPSLPFPLVNSSAIVYDNILFVTAGEKDGKPSNVFLALNLGDLQKSSKWVVLKDLPGEPRINPTLAIFNKSIYLFSGISQDNSALKDAYRFTPVNSNNEVAGDWETLSPSPYDIIPGLAVAPAMGLDHIILFARDSTYGTSVSYHVKTNSWVGLSGLGNIPAAQWRNSVQWNDDWIVGGANANNSLYEFYSLSRQYSFGWINWLTLIAYLLFMLWIGFKYDTKDQTTEHFFKAGGNIPWWAAGLSIYGAQISAITFMAVPAIVYATDWTLALGSVLILPIVPIVAKYYIPFFRRLNVTSAYQYLEHRFSKNVRLLGSLSFILFQFGRMGVVLYLPAAAIASVTGINIFLLITIMGIICITYTVMGGMQAVIWTDVAQVIILLGGALLCLIVAIMNIDGGLKTTWDVGMADDKFKLVSFGWEYDKLNFWVCVVGFFFLNLIPYTSDQSVVQRYLTVKDEKQALKSLWTNAWITMPGTILFFGLGTVLYVFYKQNTGIIASDKIDEVLPYFVVQQLPAGISGLVIAGVFAASQSTLSGSMNSVSATFFSDIYIRFNKTQNEHSHLRVARTVTVITGVFGTLSAMTIVVLNAGFMFDLFQEVLGILGGGLAGVFILGIFFARANTIGAIVGLFSSVLVVWLIKENTSISIYLYGAISIISSVAVGILVSILFPGRKPAAGLTYYSLKQQEEIN